MQPLEELKDKLVSVPIVIPSNWSLPFDIICDASDYAIGEVLGQCLNKIFHPIYYASMTFLLLRTITRLLKKIIICGVSS